MASSDPLISSDLQLVVALSGPGYIGDLDAAPEGAPKHDNACVEKRRLQKAIDVIHASDALKAEGEPGASLFYNGSDEQNASLQAYVDTHDIGIDKERIIVRPIKTVNTFDQAESLNLFLEEKKAEGCPLTHIAIVTDDFHLPRTAFLMGNTSPYAKKMTQYFGVIPKSKHIADAALLTGLPSEQEKKDGYPLNALGEATFTLFGTGDKGAENSAAQEGAGIESAQRGVYYERDYGKPLTGLEVGNNVRFGVFTAALQESQTSGQCSL